MWDFLIKPFRHQDKNGFTIIEVLIVLAIAGLILLIVFLAVPTLQRNARNNGRKQDVGKLAAAITNFYANNGYLPGTNDNTADCQTLLNMAGNLNQVDPSGNCTSFVPQFARLDENNDNSFVIAYNEGGNGTNFGGGGVNVVVIADESTCASVSYNPFALNYSSNHQVAILYTLEAGGGNITWYCLQAQ